MKSSLKSLSETPFASKRHAAAALVLPLALTARLALGAELVTDGAFDQATGNGNNSPPPGWHTIVNSFGAYNGAYNGMVPHSGAYFMHVGGNSQSGGEYQDLTTLPGAQYVLTFWAVGWTAGPSPQTGIVQVGTPGPNDTDLASNNNAEYVNQVLDQIPLFTSAASWTFYRFDFTAATETTRLSFQNVGPSAINVDDVSVFPAGAFMIITQPASLVTFCSSNATFAVEVQGAADPAYQWYRGANKLAGEVKAELTLTNVQTADSGSAFFVVVTGQAGSLTSAVATLTVECNGLLRNGGFEVSGPLSSTGHALPAQWNEIANAYGQWNSGIGDRPPRTGRFALRLANNADGGACQDIPTVPGHRYVLDFWAVGGLTGGTPQVGLVQVGTPGGADNDLAANNNAEYVNANISVGLLTGLADWTRFTFLFTAATEVTRVTFESVAPASLSIDDASVTEAPGLVITTQPANQLTDCASNVTFQVAAEGAGAIRYQWYHETNALAGATNADLLLRNVQLADAGNYFAVVRDSSQTVTSIVARLTITCSGLVYNGSFELPGPNGSQGTPIPAGWNEIFNSYGRWGARPPGQPAHGGSYVMHAGANGRSGGEYQDITTVPGQKYLLTFWAVGWLNGPAPQTGLVQVGTPGSADTDPTLNNNAEYVNAPIAVPVFTSAADWTEFSFTFTPATELTRLSFQNVSPSGGIAINIDDVSVFPATVPWVITTQPVNKTTVCSSNVTFTVGTDATEPVNYQWFFNGAALPGAVEAALDLENVKAADAGTYFAVVKDDFQTATSAVARLTVICVGGLIVNGGFEALGDKGSQNNPIPLGWHEIVNSYGCWTAQPPAKPPHSGKYVMHAGANSANGGEFQDVTTVPGTTYVLDFWGVGWISGATVQSGIVQVGTPGSLDTDLGLNNNAEYVNVTFQVPRFDSAMSWTHLSYTFTAATETTRVTLQNLGPSAINLDDVSLDLYRPGPVSISRTAQGFAISCPGIPGLTYQLQRAPTLDGPWKVLATVTGPDPGAPVEFADNEKPQSMAFYRIVLP